MLILNIVLMMLIVAVIDGSLVWSVLTQHRVPGYEHVRIRRIRQYGLTVRPACGCGKGRLPHGVRGVKFMPRGSTRAAAHNRIGGTSHGEG